MARAFNMPRGRGKNRGGPRPKAKKGTLKSVYPYSSDFVFGKGPGTKATFEIAEVASGYGMKNKIKATVSFSADTIAQLKGNSGKTFSFSGSLLKFEPFAREILVEKGTLES